MTKKTFLKSIEKGLDLYKKQNENDLLTPENLEAINKKIQKLSENKELLGMANEEN